MRGWILVLFLVVLIAFTISVSMMDGFRDGRSGGGVGGRPGGGVGGRPGGGGRVGGSRVGGGARVGGGGRVGGSRVGGGRHHDIGGRHHGRGDRHHGGYYYGGWGGGSGWGWTWPYWSWWPWGDDCTVSGCPYPDETCYVTDTGYSFCA